MYLENSSELISILKLILIITNNHRINEYFISNIEQILLFLNDYMQKFMSKADIFNIFKNNIKILMILFKNNIITFDKQLADHLTTIESQKTIRYAIFYPKVTQYINNDTIQKLKLELLDYDRNIFLNFDEKCQLGENDSYICQLIQNDSVEEFISFINQKKISLSSTIESYIFETYSFLIGKVPNLYRSNIG